MEKSSSKVLFAGLGPIVTINVGGLRFQTYEATLARYPNTLLGNPQKRRPYLNPKNGEYFFDRHRGSFESILSFYQRKGILHRPENVPVEIYVKELKFYEMGQQVIEAFWVSEGYQKTEKVVLPANPTQRRLWLMMEYPGSSTCAKIMALFSILATVLFTVAFCVETLPNMRARYQPEGIAHDLSKWENPFFLLEGVCILWFTIEVALRFASCPSKVAYMRRALFWIDLIAIVPFFVDLVLTSETETRSAYSYFLTAIRVIYLARVVQVVKLSRYYKTYPVIVLTFKHSMREIGFILFFLCIAILLFATGVYVAESFREITAVDSIPEGCWYVIVSITTVGYGDVTPGGPVGKIIGAGSCVVGGFFVGLPMAAIADNFRRYAEQYDKLALRHADEEGDERFNVAE